MAEWVSWRKKTLKSLRALVVAGFAVLTLSGCYFVDGTVRMSERDGDLIADVTVVQGVETDIFSTPEDAFDYLIQRYSGPGWGYLGTGTTAPFTYVTMGNSARVDNTQGSTGSIRDGNGSNIYIVYTEASGRPEFQVVFNMDLPTPPDGSDIEQQVTFGLVPPAGWAMQRMAGGGDAIMTESSVAWYGVGGGQQPSAIFRLFPPYTPPPETGDPVAAEPAEPTPAPSEEQPAAPSDSGGAAAESNSTSEEESSSGEESAAAENPGSDELDEFAESVKQPSTDIIGQEGRTTTEVSGAPGLVKIDSQLFPAIAMNNQVIPAGSEVAVIGVFNDGVIVEALTSVNTPGFGSLLGGSLTALAAIAAVVLAVLLRKKQKDKAPETEAMDAS